MSLSEAFFYIVKLGAFFVAFSSPAVTVRLSAGFASQPSPLVIENYSDLDVVHFPLVLLQGKTGGRDNEFVLIENLSSASSYRITKTKVVQGRFKVLVELTEGVNRLSIACGSERVDLALVYRRSSNPKFIRLVYFYSEAGELGDAEVPDEWRYGRSVCFPNTQDMVEKLRLAAKLWQTATAERLHDAGYGRRTFKLELDGSGEIVVWRQKGKKTSSDYCSESELERFWDVYNEVLSGSAYSENACFFVLTSLGTRETIEGRVALGGNRVAVLDSYAFFSCPERLDEVEEWFSDATPVSNAYSRDSAFRNARWALTSSTLGSGLHELGHAFGLGHSDDPNDFMSRGFDRFNRIFTLVEPPSDVSVGGLFDDSDVANWTSSSALKLIRSPWIEE